MMRHLSAAMTSSLLGIVIVSLILAGCGQDPHGRQAISGAVTLDDESLVSGIIDFTAEDPNGRGAGSTIDEGAFSLTAERGLAPGKYVVRIYSGHETQDAEAQPGPTSSGARRDTIPPWYNVDSELTVTVQSDAENRFDFKLKSRKQ